VLDIISGSIINGTPTIGSVLVCTLSSLAFPGTERKRTRLNAPAVATPAPILPLVSMMMICTVAGIKTSVTARLLLY
jgi:hypothetical protein